jgi:hypothetical protein
VDDDMQLIQSMRAGLQRNAQRHDLVTRSRQRLQRSPDGNRFSVKRGSSDGLLSRLADRVRRKKPTRIERMRRKTVQLARRTWGSLRSAAGTASKKAASAARRVAARGLAGVARLLDKAAGTMNGDRQQEGRRRRRRR